MGTKTFKLLISVVLLLSLTACSGNGENAMNNSTNRDVVLKNDNTNDERNRLLAEDIKFFNKELPKRHKNPFSIITKEEFNDLTDQLIDKIDKLSNKQVFVELNKIVASIGDGHTSIDIRMGTTIPFNFGYLTEMFM